MRTLAVLLMLALAGCTTVSPPQNGTDGTGKNNTTDCICPAIYKPVCGADGKTYGNSCGAGCAGVAVAYEGVCEADRSCTDSDSGKDVSVKGTTEDNSGGSNDVCIDSSSVMEFFCEGNVAKSEAMPCPDTQDCMDGACVEKQAPSPEPPKPSQDCADGDPGQDYYTASAVTKGSASYQDVCTELRIVKEYYCKDGMIQNELHLCEPGERCDMGRCVVAERSCTDSDGGDDKFQKGTVNSGSIVNMITKTDSCVDSGTVREFFCVGDGYDSTEEECPSSHECVSGECREADCEDTDGKDTLTAGQATKGSKSEEDYCTDSNTVREYFCDGDDIEYDNIDCASGYACDNGRCEPT